MSIVSHFDPKYEQCTDNLLGNSRTTLIQPKYILTLIQTPPSHVEFITK